MISVSGRKWQQKKADKNLVEKLKQEHNFSEILSKLIITRNFDQDEIFSIENDLDINNVFLNNNDFKLSVNFIEEALKNRDNICILGDYDVDGSAATALLVRYFKDIKQPFFYYIPDREKDGYGPSKKLFEKLILKKPKLVIMVDCGSTSNDAIEFLNQNNIRSLIIDHHEINLPYPKADIIINPKKDNGYIEYDYLCATTLVYFFLVMLIKKTKNIINIRDYLIYVLLATVCDVMPLRKLNRLISINALKEFNIEKNLPIKELFLQSNKKNKINIIDLGYLVGPILNSGGRLGKSNYATELLSTNDMKILNNKTTELIILNNKRKNIEAKILDEIDFDLIEKENNDVIIYYNPSINEGLIGIIAARLKDHFNRPSVVITNSNDLLKGSARSIHKYNIGRTIKNALDKNIIISGGGHSMAAGFTLKNMNLEIFREFLLNDFLKTNHIDEFHFKYDAELSSSAFNKDFFNDIKKLEPFGTGNPLPMFIFKDLKVIKKNILNNKHISLLFKSKTGFTINSISFNSINTKIGEHLLNYKKNFNVIGQINENFWNNKNSLQLTVRDIIL